VRSISLATVSTCFDNGEIPVVDEEVLAPCPLGIACILKFLGVALVLAGQHTATEWRPGSHRDIERLGHRQQLPLRCALDQAVLDLEADAEAPAMQIGQRVRLGDDPGRCIRNTDIQHLARTHQIVECPHDLVDWGYEIPRMDPVETDVVGTQSFQTPLERLVHALR